MICLVFRQTVALFTNMADESDSVCGNIPTILDGKFFQIVKTNGDSVVARCLSCVNKELSGSLKATSNFLRHLKVCVPTAH